MDRPIVFIGSSTEGLKDAHALARVLEAKGIWARPWDNDVFAPSDITIESLTTQLTCCQFAVLIVTPDVELSARGATVVGPRDNVIFEAGLFMGRLGRKSTFLLSPENTKVRLPSDLAGVTFETYDPKKLETSLGKVAAKLKKQIIARERPEGLRLIEACMLLGSNKYPLDFPKILSENYSHITSALKELQAIGDWKTLSKVKTRLAEYFEFGGRYNKGIEFAELYLSTLEPRNRNEFYWTRIKFQGYLSILAKDHATGRRVLGDCISELDSSKRMRSPTVKEQLFYAHRYLGVSFHRKKGETDLSAAMRHFKAAEQELNEYRGTEREKKELLARILRNFGNVSISRNHLRAARRRFEESRLLFSELPDEEHIATCDLKVAEVLIRQGADFDEAKIRLEQCEQTFIEIGWIEGQARVFEQYVYMHMTLSERAGANSDRKCSELRQALIAAKRASWLFRRTDDADGRDRMNREIGKISEQILRHDCE